MSSKGQKKEQFLSLKLHQKNAVLVSPKFLRRYHCGQIDLMNIEAGILKLYEVKSSSVGQKYYLQGQKTRLERSAKLLSEILQKDVQICLL